MTGDDFWQYVCNANYVWRDQVPAGACITSGEVYQPGGCFPLPRNPKCSNQKGEPCDTGTGNEIHTETDYTGTGPFPLIFTRTYNSLIGDSSNIGANWRSNYGDFTGGGLSVDTAVTPNLATVRRPNGQITYFNLVSGAWTPADADETDILTQTATGWTYTQRDGTVEQYDSTTTDAGNLTGKLLSITNPAGLTQTLNYDPTTGYLTSVTDPFGHSLTFNYDTQGRLSTMTDPDGNKTTYGYSTEGYNNLSTVTYADGTKKTYLYNEQAYTQNNFQPHALTGIIDENGNRFTTISYNAAGQVSQTEHAQTTNSVGQEQVNFVYNNGGETTTTDAVGTEEIWNFNSNLGVKNLFYKQIRNAAGTLIGIVTQAFDTNNNLTCHQDADGHVTTYTYYNTNQMLSKTEGQTGSCYPSVSINPTAPGGVSPRTTSYTYLSPTLNLLTEIDRPSVDSGQTFKTLIYYGGASNVPSPCVADASHPLLPVCISQQGFTPSGAAITRTIAMSYTADGQLAAITDPDGNVTTYAYNNCATGGGCGELASITNALTQVTTFSQYDGAGNLRQQTDPNGLSSFWYYDQRERPYLHIDNAGTGVIHLIDYTFWPSGQPGSAYDYYTGLKITNHYDAAQELYQTNDNLGEKTTDIYDANGNLTNLSTYNAGGSLATSESWTYDAFNHVASVSTPDGTTDYSKIDPLGNILTAVSPDQVASGATNINTQNQYDALNRLFQTVDRAGGITTYSYDTNDHLKQVTTPNGAQTSYVVDDLGNVLQESSPDRGVTTYTYDHAGNLLSKTDARGIVTDYQYDALNRLTTVTYPADSAENVTYTYDNCPYGKGRLCGVTDESGTTTYSYDAFGHVASKTHPSNSITYTTSYTNDPLGAVQSETYPDGRVITYTRDAKERITAVSATVNGTTTTLLSSRTFRGDNQVSSETWGNGLIESRVYDTAGRLQTQTVGTDTRVYGYDPNGNLTSLQTIPQLDCLGYDNLDRLTQKTVLTASGASCATPPATPDQTFTYDGNGNRLTETQGSTTTNYGYTALSNRLISIGGTTIPINPAGQVRGDLAGHTFAYDNAGRINNVYQSGSLFAEYGYNSQNLRTMKFSGAGVILFHYDQAGHLLDETHYDGTFVKAYVWAGNTPIAMITKDTTSGQEVVTYLHTDYDNTPRLATDSTGKIVWRWEGVFGTTAPNPNTVQVDLRYPGQYYDPETGLHYNWYRYYDPSTGRYDQVDPLSIAAHAESLTESLRGSQLLLALDTRTNLPASELDPFVDPAAEGFLFAANYDNYVYSLGNPLGRVDPSGQSPMYGNWGGANYSGGKSGPNIPSDPAPPTDALDYCYMQHDYCYAAAASKTGSSGGSCWTKPSIQDCDRQLAKCTLHVNYHDIGWWGQVFGPLSTTWAVFHGETSKPCNCSVQK